MKRKAGIAGLIAILAVPVGVPLGTSAGRAMPAEAQHPENAPSVEIGRDVARKRCSRCHAINERGASPNPKAPRFPLIAERYPGSNPAPNLIDGTVVRHPGMPEFRMPESETDGLVAYIRRISRGWRPSPPAGGAQ